VWLIIVNDRPAKAFTVKREAREWLEQNVGWSICHIWRMPDGKHPIFAPQKIGFKEFMES
jgi:hypothetical protein